MFAIACGPGGVSIPVSLSNTQFSVCRTVTCWVTWLQLSVMAVSEAAPAGAAAQLVAIATSKTSLKILDGRCWRRLGCLERITSPISDACQTAVVQGTC